MYRDNAQISRDNRAFAILRILTMESRGAGFDSGALHVVPATEVGVSIAPRGQRLVLNVDVGSIRRNIVLSFTEPYFRGTPLTVGVDAFNWRLEFERQSGVHWTGSVWIGEITPGF